VFYNLFDYSKLPNISNKDREQAASTIETNPYILKPGNKIRYSSPQDLNRPINVSRHQLMPALSELL